MFSGEPLIEFLAGLGETEQPASILDWVRQVENRPRRASCLPDLPAVAEEIGSVAQPQPGERGWAAGYRAARALRTALDLPGTSGHDPGANSAARLGGEDFEPAPDVNGIHALISRSNDEIHIHLQDRGGADWARKSGNFAFARAVGDAICFRNGGRSAIKRSSPCRTPGDRPGVFRRIPRSCRKCPGHARQIAETSMKYPTRSMSRRWWSNVRSKTGTASGKLPAGLPDGVQPGYFIGRFLGTGIRGGRGARASGFPRGAGARVPACRSRAPSARA